ncbi:MAG: hypothetical protein ABIO36_10755 [Pyrinomonadaceae bacterium]
MKLSKILCGSLLIAIFYGGVPAQNEIVPIIDLRIGGLLGGVKHGKWIEAGIAAESIMNGAMDLDVYGLRGKEKTPFYAARRAPVEDVCQDFYRINMDDQKEQLAVGIGVNGGWNAMPRIPKRVSVQNPAYNAAVVAFLKKEGVKRPVAKITQAFQIDLDNDGIDEVLITATRIKSQFGVGWRAGEYSFAMLRKVTKSGVKDYLLDGNIHRSAHDDDGAPNRFLISGIADLNGDGKMEIVLYSEYYEGSASGAFEMIKGRPEVIEELQIECGA